MSSASGSREGSEALSSAGFLGASAVVVARPAQLRPERALVAEIDAASQAKLFRPSLLPDDIRRQLVEEFCCLKEIPGHELSEETFEDPILDGLIAVQQILPLLGQRQPIRAPVA